MPEAADSIRAKLDSIGEAVASSGVKLPDSVEPPRQFRALMIGLIVCLPILLLPLVRIHEHEERVAWVNAVTRTGLKARLEPEAFGGKVDLFVPRWVQHLFSPERAIVPIHDDADVTLLLSSNAQTTTKVYLYVSFDLTMAQKIPIGRRFPRCVIESWGRGP